MSNMGGNWKLHPVLILFLINLVSVLLKLISMTGTNASSVFIDALNDIGDMVGLGLLLLGLSYERKRQSIYYPFGRRRAVYIFTLLSLMIFSGLIFAVAIFKVVAIMSETISIDVKPYSQYAFSLAFLINIVGFAIVFLSLLDKQRDPTLSSSLIDSVSDVSGSIVALITLITRNPVLDMLGSLIISGVILVSAISLGYRYFHVLIGRAPSKEVLMKIISKVLEFREVRDVNVFNAIMITEDEYMLILEVEVDKDMEVEDVEKLSTQIENEIRKLEPKFKHVIIEFVGERTGSKTYREILKQIESHE
jgi:cation diffusion facilitator family transporter